MSILLVYATAPNRETAQKIARTLLDDQLIACANIMPGMESIYRWQGKIESAAEVAMIFKTSHRQMAALQQKFLALHPYDVPALAAIPIEAAPPDFAAWVEAETQIK